MNKIDKPMISAFTQKWDGIVNVMISDAQLKSGDAVIPIKALWDTGASKTCISPQCVERLKLVSTGRCTNHTACGPSEARTYLVDVLLPNRVIAPDVVVTDAQIGDQGFDALIGMDLITMGDFTISNSNGKTVLSYRIPSQKVSDYVMQINIEKITGKYGKGKSRR